MEKSKAGLRSAAWTKAVHECAEPQRARHFLELLRETSAVDELEKASPEQARILAAVFSASQTLGSLLAAHPEWLGVLHPEELKYGRRKQGLRQERDSWLAPLIEAADFASALALVRELKSREMLRIGARDLAHV